VPFYFFIYSSVASALNNVVSAEYAVSSADNINAPAQQAGADNEGIASVVSDISPNQVEQ
jgi:hypothetical protein